MKKIFSAVLGGCLLLGACAATEQKTITIKGKVCLIICIEIYL